MSHNDIPTRLETRARLREAALRTECCGALMRGQCSDCPLTVPLRPLEFFMQRVRLFAWLAAIGMLAFGWWVVRGAG